MYLIMKHDVSRPFSTKFLFHLIIIHMYRGVRKNVGKSPYSAFIALIMRSEGIDVIDVTDQTFDSIEIGKETLKKMTLRMTLDGWVNPRNEVISIGQGDDVKAKDVRNEWLKETAKIERKRKAKAPVPVQRQSSVHPPQPAHAMTWGKLTANIAPALAQLQEDIIELKITIASIGQYLVRLEWSILNLNCYGPLRSITEKSASPFSSQQRKHIRSYLDSFIFWRLFDAFYFYADVGCMLL